MVAERVEVYDPQEDGMATKRKKDDIAVRQARRMRIWQRTFSR
jgi:hypothetical protein